MLVDYTSDSDSESEQKQLTPPPESQPSRLGVSEFLPKPKGARKSAGGGGEDGPKKIIVNLPKFKDDGVDDGPPTKKARVCGGSSLSAMLPAPKRSGAALRNAPPPPPSHSQETHKMGEEIVKVGEDKKVPSLDNEGMGRSTKFVPQSVARKPIQPTSSFKHSGTSKSTVIKQKISLFGTGPSLSSCAKSVAKSVTSGEYQPIMLTTAAPANRPEGTMSGARDETPYFEETNSGVIDRESNLVNSKVESRPQDLETVAREAGLDNAAMRQLYGRRGRGNAPINITNYSVDQEYNNNEVNRSMGLLEEVKPVRSIAPGKHQLSSLLNAAQSQRGALEDSFAQGKRNKKEAGSKYGW